MAASDECGGAPGPIRCAIYTRKSSEEGLDQAFNSLHAQRDACSSYIRSQMHEGWIELAEEYDDGGFSGGTMERPGLARLLADIRAGKIDTIVVYKIDRLTRSLTDFSKMVELFDAQKVSFVSVTQQFNTTTSMGRLTLNILLSFAQFEREVTGERIRDKIAASKARGIWMGGIPPLGYDAKDRQLIINPQEADQLRSIFRRYLEIGSVHLLQAELEQQGVRSKLWTTKLGKEIGGASFTRGALYHLLRNRVVLGQITHKDKVYKGQHPAVMNVELFEAVQTQLDEHARRRRGRKAVAASSPLIGLLSDTAGQSLTPTFAYGKSRRIYRYYVVQALLRGPAANAPTERLQRVSAPALEALVLERLDRIGGWSSWLDALPHLTKVVLGGAEITLTVDVSTLDLGSRAAFAQARLQDQVEQGDEVRLDLAAGEATVMIPVRAKFRGGRTWLLPIEGSASSKAAAPDPVLVAGLKTGHALARQWNLNPTGRPAVFAGAKTPRQLYQRDLCGLTYLAPDIQNAILEGRQPQGLTLRALLKEEIPLSWAEQQVWFRNL